MAAIPNAKTGLIKRLYYTEEFSAKKIAEHLNVSLDAVYYFMRCHGLKRRSFSEDSRLRFERKKPSFTIKKRLLQGEEYLKITGTMLYWCEGYKSEKGSIVDFANSDPVMVRFFVSFLRRICGVYEKKLKVLLYCYANQNVPSLIHFWSECADIPKEQFSKPYIRKDFDIKKKNKMPYGMVHIRYGDKKLLLLIKEWIKEYKESLTTRVGSEAVKRV